MTLGPNLQNIPIRTPEGKRIRDAFKGQNMWTFDDWGELELDFGLRAHGPEEGTGWAAEVEQRIQDRADEAQRQAEDQAYRNARNKRKRDRQRRAR